MSSTPHATLPARPDAAPAAPPTDHRTVSAVRMGDAAIYRRAAFRAARRGGRRVVFARAASTVGMRGAVGGRRPGHPLGYRPVGHVAAVPDGKGPPDGMTLLKEGRRWRCMQAEAVGRSLSMFGQASLLVIYLTRSRFRATLCLRDGCRRDRVDRPAFPDRCASAGRGPSWPPSSFVLPTAFGLPVTTRSQARSAKATASRSGRPCRSAALREHSCPWAHVRARPEALRGSWRASYDLRRVTP
jgi:hypothetical protein